MFGYITVHQQELKIRDYDTYRSYYCGLCHILKSKYGRNGQLLLNYDMTFLALLLTGLYELKGVEQIRRCIPHPLQTHLERTNEATDYAADMTVLLAYEKAMDDWRDEKNAARRLLAGALQRDVDGIKDRFPRQAQALAACVASLSRLEGEGCADPDLVSGMTGTFLGEIFVWQEDLWQEDLREMGFFLGKFIYLADAFEDYEKDEQKGNYNLLGAMARETLSAGVSDPAFAVRCQQMMTDMMARASRAFERLPVLEHEAILRNILYAGVWTRVAAARKKRGAQAAHAMKETVGKL